MAAAFGLIRPLLFQLDPERAHDLTIAALEKGFVPGKPHDDPVLRTTVAGLNFRNPIGLAAGFDKDARAPRNLIGLGFGFVEVGTLTPRPQPGNPKPRIFRLPEDRAVINRLGFNNGGIDEAIKRLRKRHWEGAGQMAGGLIGINVGANKDSTDRIADYEIGVRKAAPIADYLTINISSPNTPGLRDLQSRDALAELIGRSLAARDGRTVPLFVKVAPDLTDREIADIAEVAIAGGIDALIVSNTTVDRRENLSGEAKTEAGGLSGQPLKEKAHDRLVAFREAVGTSLPLIAAGGIASGVDAYARIRAGASLIQLYTAMIYAGPGLPARIAKDLSALLKVDGFASVAEAVGVDA
ncbi:MAG: quinone-dependent dihydroorotate dehydrogenase [Pacificimonas sp.]